MPASPLTALVDRFIRANEFTGAAVVAYQCAELVLEHYAVQARWAASRALCWAATVALAAATGASKAACRLVSWARVVMGDGMGGSFVVGGFVL